MKLTTLVVSTLLAAPGFAAAQPSAIRALSTIPPAAPMYVSQQQHMRGRGVVLSVDARRHKVEIRHEGIADLGVPPGVTQFGAVIAVKLKNIHPGMEVDFEFTVEKGDSGHLLIHSIASALPPVK